MNKTIIAAMGVFATALLSCTTREILPEDVLDYASDQAAEITVAPGGGEINLAFVSTADWNVSTVENWFDFEQLSGKGGNNKLAVKVSPNHTGVRSGVIRIESGEKTLPFTITQDVSDYISALGKTEFEVDPKGGSVELSFSSTNRWTAATEASWLALSQTEGEPGKATVTVIAEENPDEEASRTATVIVSCGEEKVEFTIFQDVVPPAPPVTDGTYDDWLGTWESIGADGTKISFNITQKKSGQTYTISGFGENVEGVYDVATGHLLLPFQEAGGNSNFTFYLAGVGTNNYVAYGDNDEGVLAIVSLTADNKAKAQGNEYDYVFPEGDTEHYLVDWIGLMGFGPRSDGSTGWVSFSDVDYLYLPADWTKTGSGGGGGGDQPSTGGYAKWLGEWNVTRQSASYNESKGQWEYKDDVTDTWTITQKVNGTSYIITGMNGEEFPVEAIYNTDGTFSIANGQEVGSANFQGFDYALNISLVGTYLSDDGSAYRITGGYDICFASLTSDTEAKLIPNRISVNGLGDIDLSVPRFYATDPKTNVVYGFDGYIMTVLPAKMTKVGGSGGGDTGSSDYSSFLGSWTWYSVEDATNYSFTVKQSVANQSYVVEGFGMPLTTYYNNGKMEFCFDILDVDDEYYYLFAGYDQDDYIEFGDAENNDLLATATVGGGAMSIKGHSYTAIYGGVSYDETICGVGIYALTLDQEFIYSFQGVPYVELPGTWNTSSASGISAQATSRLQMNMTQLPGRARKMPEIDKAARTKLVLHTNVKEASVKTDVSGTMFAPHAQAVRAKRIK